MGVTPYYPDLPQEDYQFLVDRGYDLSRVPGDPNLDVNDARFAWQIASPSGKRQYNAAVVELHFAKCVVPTVWERLDMV